MKGTAAILLFVTLFISGHAYARTEAEVQQDLIKAATTAVTVFKEDGMSGLIEKTQTCYDNANENGFYCFYFDLAARHIDQIAVAGAVQQGMKFPKTPFFDDDLFGSRAALLFQKANMDMKTSNDYLNSVTPVINKLVEDNLQTASQAPISNKRELPETQSQTGNQSNTANVVGTPAGEQIPATAQHESQQSSNERKKEIAKYVIITLLLVSLISVILHFNGKLVLYKDYTDAAVTVGGILGSVLLLFICTIFLGLTPRTTWIVVLSFFIPISIFVFRMTYITNSNIFFITLSLLTKYTTTFIYAFLMASLMFSGSSASLKLHLKPEGEERKGKSKHGWQS